MSSQTKCIYRYFNPAIFSPEAMGLLPAGKVPSAQSRRNLILITKVLQVFCRILLLFPIA